MAFFPGVIPLLFFQSSGWPSHLIQEKFKDDHATRAGEGKHIHTGILYACRDIIVYYKLQNMNYVA